MTYALVKPDSALTAWIEKRERDGLDGRDEIWNGVLHLVPPANGHHQRLEAWLLRHLAPAAETVDLVMTAETGLWVAADDYKVPDIVAASEDHWSGRGIEVPAELVIEIRSPGDETMDKIDWYAAHGVEELLVIDRDSKDIKRWYRGASDESAHDGWYQLRKIPVEMQGEDGKIRVRTNAGVVEF